MSTTTSESGSTTSGPQSVYFEMLRAGIFKIQYCSSCLKHIFFPRTLCPHCGQTELTWVEPTGKGSIYSTTTVRRDSANGGDYNISLVDLHEGVRVMAKVLSAGPSTVTITQRVTLDRAAVGKNDMLIFTIDGEEER